MVPFIAEGGAADQGHPHQGKVPPFEPGDPKVKLDNGAIQTLQSGKPYQVGRYDGRQEERSEESGPLGLVVFHRTSFLLAFFFLHVDTKCARSTNQI